MAADPHDQLPFKRHDQEEELLQIRNCHGCSIITWERCRQSTIYEEFTKLVGLSGRKIIRCVTAPRKKDSIAFHTRLGFLIESENNEVEGIPVFHNYNGRGGDRVVFKKMLN